MIAAFLTVALAHRFTTAIIIQIVTGHEVEDIDDTYVGIADNVSQTMKGGGPPGATGVDLLPLRTQIRPSSTCRVTDPPQSALPSQLVRPNRVYGVCAQDALCGDQFV